jgi:hypothetical protein
MKRFIILLAAIIISATATQAQNRVFGLKGGLNFASLPATMNGSTPEFSLSAFSDSYTGYHAGIFGMFVFRGGFFQPELIYTQTGRDMRIEFLGSEQDDEYFTQKYSHLVLPLHAGAKFGAFKVSAAPVFSYLVREWNDLGQDLNFQAIMNELTLGYQLGAGFHLGGLVLDFRYQGNFTKFGEGFNIAGQPIKFDNNPSQYILSLGIMF